MPTFFSCSSLRETAENFGLIVHARHTFVAGQPSDTPLKVKGCIPETVDVILGSDLVFTLAGTVNSTTVACSVLQRSAVAKIVLSYLRVNASQLGLSTITEVYIDEDDGRAKFSVTSSRPLRHGTQQACVYLTCIDLVFACKPNLRNEDPQTFEGADLFAAHAFLPLTTAFERIFDRFVSAQLVRRYPLIFGPWRQRLDSEAVLFPSLTRSIEEIAGRSTDDGFHRKFRQLVKTLKRRHSGISSKSHNTLRKLLGEYAGDLSVHSAVESDNSILCRSLEHLFKKEVRPALFKGSRVAYTHEYAQDDEERLFNLSHDSSSCALSGSAGLQCFQDDAELCTEANWTEADWTDTDDGSELALYDADAPLGTQQEGQRTWDDLDDFSVSDQGGDMLWMEQPECSPLDDSEYMPCYDVSQSSSGSDDTTYSIQTIQEELALSQPAISSDADTPDHNLLVDTNTQNAAYVDLLRHTAESQCSGIQRNAASLGPFLPVELDELDDVFSDPDRVLYVGASIHCPIPVRPVAPVLGLNSALDDPLNVFLAPKRPFPAFQDAIHDNAGSGSGLQSEPELRLHDRITAASALGLRPQSPFTFSDAPEPDHTGHHRFPDCDSISTHGENEAAFGPRSRAWRSIAELEFDARQELEFAGDVERDFDMLCVD